MADRDRPLLGNMSQDIAQLRAELGEMLGLRWQLAGLELDPSDNEKVSLQDKLERFEKHLIGKTLQQCRGNVSEAARILKVDRANLSKKVSSWGLKGE